MLTFMCYLAMKVARERRSSVLASNAIHHRVDSMTGIVTLLAILGANMFQNAAWLDPVGGLLISIMVFHAGYANSLQAFQELVDRGIDDQTKRSVRKNAQAALAKVDEGHRVEFRDVSGIKSGQNFLVDIEAVVPGDWTVNSLKNVEDAIRLEVGAKVRGARRIRLRFVSTDSKDAGHFDEYISGSVFQDQAKEKSDEASPDEKHQSKS